MRDSQLPPPPDEGGDEGEDQGGEHLSPGHLRPIGWGALVAWVLVGVAVGWAWHAAADTISHARPVGWLQTFVLWFLAALLGGLALMTRRAVRDLAGTIDPERMVNRLVLGRACTIAGALLAGGHLGYAIPWWTGNPDLRLERVGIAGLAALGGLLVLLGGKLLEWACRVPPSGPSA